MYQGISIGTRVVFRQSAVLLTSLLLGVSGARASSLSGTIMASAGPGSPVARARVMLFDPTLTTFQETRTDVQGSYGLEAPSGTYRLGVAALDFEYQEVSVTLGPGPLQRP